MLRQIGVEGVLVASADGPAKEAGIRATRRDRRGNLQYGDIIVGLNGTPIKSTADMLRAIGDKAVGDDVTLTLLRPTGKRKRRKVLVYEHKVTLQVTAAPKRR